MRLLLENIITRGPPRGVFSNIKYDDDAMKKLCILFDIFVVLFIYQSRMTEVNAKWAIRPITFLNGAPYWQIVFCRIVGFTRAHCLRLRYTQTNNANSKSDSFPFIHLSCINKVLEIIKVILSLKFDRSPRMEAVKVITSNTSKYTVNLYFFIKVVS